MLNIKKLNVNFLITILLLFIVRMGLPQYLKYILFPLVAIFGIWSIGYFYSNKSWKSTKRNNILIFTPFILSIIIYWVAVIFTRSVHEYFFHEVFNVLIFSAFVVAVFLADYTEYEFKYSLGKVNLLALIFCSIFALLGIIKFIFQLYGLKFSFLLDNLRGYPVGVNLINDNNFFSLFCLLGFVLALPFTTKKLKPIYSLLLQIGFYIIITCVFFSTSRRGLIAATLFLLIFIIISILSIPLNRFEKLRNIRFNTLFFLVLSLTTIGGFYWFIKIKTPVERINWLYNHPKINKGEVTLYISRMVIQGQLIANGKTEYYDVDESLWKMEFDSRYSYTGWAASNYKPVKKIEGESSEIVPEGAEGALVDSSVRGSTWGGHAYYYSRLFDEKIEPGKALVASVYCYVSTDFSGDNLEIGAEHAQQVQAKSAVYDLKSKGKWQKLEVSFVGDTCPYKVGLFMRINHASDIRGLKGYMIFAYPELKEISRVKNSVLPIATITNKPDSGLSHTFTSKESSSNIHVKADTLPDNRFIGRISGVVRNFFSLSDSTGQFKRAMGEDFFAGPRVDRWRYALFLYLYQYNSWQKLIGGGFGYTSKYPDIFRDQFMIVDYDYPHSPFFSILLYSGIFGLLAYIWLLFGAIKYYWIYRKDYWNYGLAFITAFFYAFFSSNNPFEPAILGILIIIPYFIHYYKVKAEL